jgi:hypothetical protein
MTLLLELVISTIRSFFLFFFLFPNAMTLLFRLLQFARHARADHLVVCLPCHRPRFVTLVFHLTRERIRHPHW